MTNQEFIKTLRKMLENIGKYEEEDKLSAERRAEYMAYWYGKEEKKAEEKKAENRRALDEKLYEDVQKFVVQFPVDYSDNGESFSDELEFEIFKLLFFYSYSRKLNEGNKPGAFFEKFGKLFEGSRKCRFLKMPSGSRTSEYIAEILILLENDKLLTFQNFDKLIKQKKMIGASFIIAFLYCLQNLKLCHFSFGKNECDALLEDPSSAVMVAHCLQMIKVVNKLAKEKEESKISIDPAENEQLNKLIKLAKDNIQVLFDVSKYGSQIHRCLLRNLYNQEDYSSDLFQTIRNTHNMKLNDDEIYTELTKEYHLRMDYDEPNYSGEAFDELNKQPNYDSMSNEEKIKFVWDYAELKTQEFKKHKNSTELQEAMKAKEAKEAKEAKLANLERLIKLQENLQGIIFDKFYHSNPVSKVAVLKEMSKAESLSTKIPPTHSLAGLIMSYAFFEPVKKFVKDIPVKNMVAEHFASKEKKEYKAKVDKYSKTEFGAEALQFTNKIFESLDIKNVCVIDTGMLQRIEEGPYGDWYINPEVTLDNLLKKLQEAWPQPSEIPYKRYIAAIIPTLPNDAGVPQHATLMLIDRDQMRIECIDSYGEAEDSGLPFVKGLLNKIQDPMITFDPYILKRFDRKEVPPEITESVRKLYDELCAYKVVYPPDQIQIQQTDQTTCVPHTVANLIGMVIEKENYQFDSKMDSKSDEAAAVAFLKKLRIDVESGHGIGQRSAEDLFDIIGIMKLGRDAYHAEEQVKEAKRLESNKR